MSWSMSKVSRFLGNDGVDWMPPLKYDSKTADGYCCKSVPMMPRILVAPSMKEEISVALIPRLWARILRAGMAPGIIVACCLFLLSAPAWGQITLVHVTTCGSQSFPTVPCTIPATGSGNLIVVGWASAWGTIPTVTGMTDNAGNTYAEAGNSRSVDSANDIADIWYAKNSRPGATSITITPSASGMGAATIWEFSGVDTVSPLGQTAVLNSQPATTTPVGASVTTNTPNQVIISLMTPAGSPSGILPGNPFNADSLNFGVGWAHLFTSTIGTYTRRGRLPRAPTQVAPCPLRLPYRADPL